MANRNSTHPQEIEDAAMARRYSDGETTGETETVIEDNWFVRGARQAGLCVIDGKVYGQTDGFMFEVPAPRSCEDAAAFTAYSLVKHAEYRIGQNQGGDLNAATAEFVSKLGEFKPARNANAGEAVYLAAVESTVRDLIVGADGSLNAGEDAKIPDTYLLPFDDENGNRRLRLVPKGTEGAYRMQAVLDSVAKDQRHLFDTTVAAAMERGRDKPKEEKVAGKRGRSARVVSLGISLA